MSHTSIPAGAVLIGRQGPQQLLFGEVRPEHIYDEGGVKIGFSHVLACLFGGVIIPLALSALVELRRMAGQKVAVVLHTVLPLDEGECQISYLGSQGRR